MPPPSSSGSVLRWPSSAHVLEQAARWARCQAATHPELVAVGIFGSYGRGDAGVGSDLDLLRAWDTADLPLATDLLTYSRLECESLPAWNPKLAATLDQDMRWLIAPAEA